MAGVAAHAQLNENCVVSVLNRTAQVRADGSWTLPNVPSSNDFVRARATCVENGVTRIGHSRPFRVPLNGGAFTNDFVFTQLTPVPASVALAAPTTALGTGASVQLTVTATYPNGTTGDVSGLAKGTQYRSTNANVVSVSADGVVTGVSSGMAIISATNENTLAMLRFSVLVVSDSDGDGMPNDYELANGFNPNDPSDGPLDADADGLTNTEEFNTGTNPRVYDTDGDGIGDGLEIDTQTDPLDPTSFNFNSTLQSISIVPAAVTIYMNTFLDGGSASVTVSGVLTDGVPVDLTSRARGTQYAVNNGAVATVGTVDGQIVGVATGNALLTVRAGTLTATAPITVTQFSPSVQSVTSINHGATEMAISGNYLFVAAWQGGVIIYDVTNRAAPREVSRIGGFAAQALVTGNILYVANPSGETGIDVYDISVPSAPVKLATKIISGGSQSLAISRGQLYSLNGAGLTVVKPWPDLTTTGTLAVSGLSWLALDPEGTVVAAVGAMNTWLTTIDVSNPAAPKLGRNIGLPGLNANNVRGVRVVGHYAYVAEQLSGGTTYAVKMDVVDISNPYDPLHLASRQNFLLSPLEFAIPRSGLLFAGGSGTSVLSVWNLTVPSAPAPAPSLLLHNVGIATQRIAVDGQYVYGILRNLNTQATSLHIARYVRVDDTAARPPMVRITAPSSSTTIMEGAQLEIDVTATDDVAIDGIDLYVGAQRMHTIRSSPATFRYTVPIGTRSLTFQAKAADFGGNVGTSAPVQLAVAADMIPPTVSIVTPAQGATVTTGRVVTVEVSAGDNARLTAVELYVNGTLSQSKSAPPYSYSVFVSTPAGGQLAVEVRAIDAANNKSTAAVTLNVVADQPPTVRILSPLTADGLYSGADVRVTIEASDDAADPRVDLLVNGSSWDRLFRPPYEFVIALAAGTRSVRLAARATDSAGQITTSAEVVLNLPFVETLSQLTLPGPGMALAISGHAGFIAAGRAGLSVVDLTNPAVPVVIGNVATGDAAVGVGVSGPYAFIAASTAGFIVADVATPSAPITLATLSLIGGARSVVLDGARAWVAGDAGVHIIDLRNPRVPRIVQLLPTPGIARAVAVAGTVAYVLHDNDGGGCTDCTKLLAVDISAEPQTVGSIYVETGPGTPGVGLTADGSTLYAYGQHYIVTVDVRNPAAPAISGTFDNTNFNHCCWSDLRRLGSIVFAANRGGTNGGVKLFDARNPADLRLIGAAEFSIPTAFHGLAVNVTPELIYATGDESGRRPVRFETPPASRLAIGRWRTVTDSAGAAPNVWLEVPVNGATVIVSEAVPIAITASDDIAVKEVRIVIDGALVSTLSVAPYTYLATLQQGSHVITATAVDFGGNETASTEVTVHVVTDIGTPSVRVTTPTPGSTVGGPADLFTDTMFRYELNQLVASVGHRDSSSVRVEGTSGETPRRLRGSAGKPYA